MRSGAWRKRRGRQAEGAARVSGFATIAALWRELGPLRFFLLTGMVCALVAGFIIAYIALARPIGWPEAYGVTCRGRGCLFDELWHSPRLLHGGSGGELAMFAFLWFMPATAAITLAWAAIRRWARQRRNRIRPMRPD